MKILNIPYFAGGLSHLLPLMVLNQKFLNMDTQIRNQFLVNNNLQSLLKMKGIDCVPLNFFGNDDMHLFANKEQTLKYVIEKHQEAFEKTSPELILEDTSFTSPLIAEKNNVPRISIQRTGLFRSIDDRFKNAGHVHSMQKADYLQKQDVHHKNDAKPSFYNESDRQILLGYRKAKAKIIPGIPLIERLPEDIQDRESYFYSGPLIVNDKPSQTLTERLDEFLMFNKQKPIVFITTGTVDKTPIEKFIEILIKRNYAVITTCKTTIQEEHKGLIFYNGILPLNHICKIANLVIHQCGSGMYHYPIINRTPFLTLGTQCYDREDIAQRLQELGVSGHVPHPDDNPKYLSIFTDLLDRFEQGFLVDYEIMDLLRAEIKQVTSDFSMHSVIQYALN